MDTMEISVMTGSKHVSHHWEWKNLPFTWIHMSWSSPKMHGFGPQQNQWIFKDMCLLLVFFTSDIWIMFNKSKEMLRPSQPFFRPVSQRVSSDLTQRIPPLMVSGIGFSKHFTTITINEKLTNHPIHQYESIMWLSCGIPSTWIYNYIYICM